MGTGNDNFQRGLMPSPHCRGCHRDCVVVYDSHHDEFFSETCGTVIMEMGVFVIPFNVSGNWMD